MPRDEKLPVDFQGANNSSVIIRERANGLLTLRGVGRARASFAARLSKPLAAQTEHVVAHESLDTSTHTPEKGKQG